MSLGGIPRQKSPVFRHLRTFGFGHSVSLFFLKGLIIEFFLKGLIFASPPWRVSDLRRCAPLDLKLSMSLSGIPKQKSPSRLALCHRVPLVCKEAHSNIDRLESTLIY